MPLPSASTASCKAWLTGCARNSLQSPALLRICSALKTPKLVRTCSVSTHEDKSACLTYREACQLSHSARCAFQVP